MISVEALNILLGKRRHSLPEIDIFTGLTVFNKDSLAHWDKKMDSLSDEFKLIGSINDKFIWLKKLFHDMFAILFHDKFVELEIGLQDLANLLIRLIELDPIKNTSIIGKLFIASSNSLANVAGNGKNETRLVDLAQLVKPIYGELFKFSWISTKLTERNSVLYLRHLLKKSKYELKKSNLFTENATGWSQLTILFLTFYRDKDNLLKIDYYLEEMYFIVGKYSLELLRCIDLFLNVSKEYILNDYKIVISFLQKTDWLLNSKLMLTEVVIFNLNGYNKDSQNYQNMVSILIKEKILDFEQVWMNLTPTNEILIETLDKYDTFLDNESMKGSQNPLAMAAALSNIDDEVDEYNNENDKDDQQSKKDIDENDIVDNDDSNSFDKIKESPKLLLLESLLNHGCLTESLKLLRDMPRLLYFNDDITRAFTRLFSYIIEPLYRNTSYCQFTNNLTNEGSLYNNTTQKPRLYISKPSFRTSDNFELNVQFYFYYQDWTKNINQIDTFDDLFKTSNELLSLIGPNLAKDLRLLSKLCRIAIDNIKKNNNEENVITRWIDYTRKFIFPAVGLLESDPTISTEIYNLLKLFPFETRYFLYSEMLNKLSKDSLLVRIGFNKSEREARTSLKALSTDTIVQESRNLSRLISSNPIATLIPTLKQLENYDKVSELLIYTSNYFNEFAYDVLQYIILLRLSLPRASVQADGVNQASWVLRLAIFIAGLAKNCNKMDLSNIIMYVIKALHTDNIIAVTILKELILTVGGIRDLNEVNINRLIMLNSGPPVKKEARKLIFDFRDANAEVAKKLVSLFIKANAISEIILLLYNLNLKVNTKQAHYKILSTRCDEMSTLLWSFIELTKFCCTDEEFLKNVLPFQELTDKYHMSTAWVFQVWRDFIDKKNAESNGSDESNESLNKIMENAVFPDVKFENLSKDMFITFWKLSLFDIHLDEIIYNKLKENLETQYVNERMNRKKHVISNKIRQISESLVTHKRVYDSVSSKLNRKVEIWFEKFDEINMKSFLQYAILPRVLFSPSDAVYSAHFILKLFPLEQLVKFYNVFITSAILKTLIFSCTTSEASNLGIFFSIILQNLEDMRSTDKFVNYRRTLYEWHCTISEQILALLKEKNYMSIRNCIEFMKHVSSLFPVINIHIEILCEQLETNLQSEQREDIKLPTNALLGHLKARLKKGSITVKDFCPLSDDDTAMYKEYEDQLKEIKDYEHILINKAKEQEMREILERKKKNRDQGNKIKEQEVEKGNQKSTIPQDVPSAKESNETKLSLTQRLNNLPKAPGLSRSIRKDEFETSDSKSRDQTVGGTGDSVAKIKKMEQIINKISEPLSCSNLIELATKFENSSIVRQTIDKINSDSQMHINTVRSKLNTIFRDYLSSIFGDLEDPMYQSHLTKLENLINTVTRPSNVVKPRMSRYNTATIDRASSEISTTAAENNVNVNANKSDTRTTKLPTTPSHRELPTVPSGNRERDSNSTKNNDNRKNDNMENRHRDYRGSRDTRNGKPENRFSSNSRINSNNRLNTYGNSNNNNNKRLDHPTEDSNNAKRYKNDNRNSRQSRYKDKNSSGLPQGPKHHVSNSRYQR